MKRKHKIPANWKLRIGIGFIVIAVIASLTSTYWLPKDPYFMESLRTHLNNEGGIEYSLPPYKLGSDNWISTDLFGRDLFSRMIVGAKMTFIIIFLLTLGKIVISIPLGMLAGGGARILSKITEYWAFVFSGFPSLFAAVFIFSMPIFSELSFWNRIFAMVIIIIFLEWARIALIIKGRTEQIMEEPYIEGAKVLGRSRIGILRFHVWRMIFPDVTVLFIFECARSLMLMGQMAMFGIFFLDTVKIENEPLPPIRTALTPEWGALLGESRSFIFSNPAVTFIIAGTIVITIVALNLIGDGLKEKYLYPLPPKKQDWVLNRPLWQKAGVVLGLIAIVSSLFLYVPTLSTTTALAPYEGSIETELKALSNRSVGSDEALVAAEIIASHWEDIGLQPMGEQLVVGKKYAIKRPQRDTAYLIAKKGTEVQSIDQGDGVNLFHLPNVSQELGEVTAPIVMIEPKDSTLIEQISLGTYDGKILVLPVLADNQTYYEQMNTIVKTILNQSDVKGVIYTDNGGYYRLLRNNRQDSRVDLKDVTEDKLRYLPVFVAREEVIETVIQADTVTLSVQWEGVMSRNVEAKLGDKHDPTKRTIMFYSYYDRPFMGHLTPEARDKEEDVSAQTIATLTQLAKSLHEYSERPDFNYYFAAIDGTNGKHYGFRQWLAKHPEIVKEEPFMIQIQHETVPARFEKIGATLATLTYNLKTQADRNATERALSVSAWKEEMVPYHGKSSLNIPKPLNGTVKHINLISHDDQYVPFMMRFVDNLYEEYRHFFETNEGKLLEKEKKRQELLKIGTEIKDELNEQLKKAYEEQSKDIYLDLFNEANTLFVKEQERFFDEYLYQPSFSSSVVWVILQSEDKGEAKIQINRSTEMQIVYELSKTEQGWKLNDKPYEMLQANDITIYYLPDDRKKAENILEQVGKIVELFQKEFKWQQSGPLEIKLYDDNAELSSTIPKFPSEMGKMNVNGWSEISESIKLQTFAKTTAIVHEIAKRMLSELTNDNVTPHLREGFASFFQASVKPSETGPWSLDIDQAMRSIQDTLSVKEFYGHLEGVNLPPISKLFVVEKGNYIDYDAGTFLAYYLIKEQGLEQMKAFMTELRKQPYIESRPTHKTTATTELTEKALTKTYGSLDKLTTEWHQYMNEFKKAIKSAKK